MKHRFMSLTIALAACCLLAIPEQMPAQVSGQLEIEAKSIPGQLDVLQGTAFQLGGTPPDTGPRPSSYRWEILEGEGGNLLKPDQAEAIFQAPVLEGKSMELFRIQLTATYAGQEPATAQLHVRSQPTSRSELTYLYGFEEFGSLDAWPSRMEVLSAAYGEKEAARLSAALASLAKTTTSLWTLESELSQLAGKQ